MSPVSWHIVRFDAHMDDLDGSRTWHSIGAEAPPEVVPAVWTHEGCETCGGSEVVRDAVTGTNLIPCPAPARLVPWSGETT